MLRSPPVVLLLLTLATTSAAADEFSPRLLDAVLVVDGKRHEPGLARSPGIPGRRIGTHRFRFHGSKLVAVSVTSGRTAWSVSASPHPGRRILAAAGGILYLSAGKPTGGPLRIRRVRILGGKQLAPLVVVDKAPVVEVVRAVVASPSGRVYSLSGAGKRGQLDDVRVVAFDGTERTWSRQLPVRERCLTPAVGLSIPGGCPERGIRPLCLAGERLVVLPGTKEDLVGLEVKTGEVAWREEAIWEYERGFIGPSIWEYFVSRGVDRKDAEALAQLRNRCCIAAGPVAVANPARPEHPRIFVAVTHSPGGPVGRYLTESRVIEFVGDNPVACAPLPLSVGGAIAHEGGALFFSGDTAFGWCRPSTSGSGPFFLGGGDATARLAWWREIPFPVLRVPAAPAGASVTTGMSQPEPAVFAIGGGRTIRAPAFSILTRDHSGVLRIPMAILDLRTGRQRRLDLEIPCTGDPPLPHAWYGKFEMDDGTGGGWLLRGTTSVRATAIMLRADHLSVFLAGPDGRTAELRFAWEGD